jgi:hypothetical protein
MGSDSGRRRERELRSYIHRISGRECPKQYFPIVGTTSLLEQTLARVSLRLAPQRTLAVVNQTHQGFYSAIGDVLAKILFPEDDEWGTGSTLDRENRALISC